MLMLVVIAGFRAGARPARYKDAFPVLVAISHICVPEDGCSSAKVLVTEAGVGPGTWKRDSVTRLTILPSAG